MKLLTNENNTQALKVVIASKVVDKCVDIHIEPLESMSYLFEVRLGFPHCGKHEFRRSFRP